MCRVDRGRRLVRLGCCNLDYGNGRNIPSRRLIRPITELGASDDDEERARSPRKLGNWGAAPDLPAHQAPIRTPKQLVMVLVLAFVVPVIVILLLVTLVTSGIRTDREEAALS